MGKLSGAEKKVVPVGSNWREARHLKTFGTEEFVRVRINFISNRTNTCPMLLFRNKRVQVFPSEPLVPSEQEHKTRA